MAKRYYGSLKSLNCRDAARDTPLALLSPFVAAPKQAGYGFTPFILFLGSGLLFVGTAVWGAFYGLSASSFSARVLLGARISLVFALAATLWIVYLGFFEGR